MCKQKTEIMKMTKKEQQELLLCETKKTLQKELAHFKGRKILTSEELIKMKETSKMWDERLNMKKKFTPLENLQFPSFMDKWRLVRPIVENMVFHVKPGPYDQSIKELEGFNIDVQGLLFRIKRLEEERDNEITELKAIITKLKVTIKGNEYIIELQKGNLKLQEEIIQLYEDCNIDQTETMNALGLDSREEGPLRVVR